MHLRLTILASSLALSGAVGCAAGLPVSPVADVARADEAHADEARADEARADDRAEEVGAALEVGEVLVEGGDVSDAAAVAADLEGELRHCAGRSDGGADATAKGAQHLSMHAKIGPNGDVRFVRPAGGDDLDGTLVACITGRVSTAQFAPPTGQDPTVVIPIAFSTRN